MKTPTRILTPFLSLAVLAALSCSKTQDTAPERRIFGNPPTIQSVDPVFYDAEIPTECNFTDIVLALFCQFQYLDVEPQTGTGFTVVFSADKKERFIRYSDQPTTEPGVFIQGTYSELTFKVRATDPESTPQQSNILLVSASYIKPDSKSETSLVLFDDGSENAFRFEQEAQSAENCTVDLESGSCVCQGAVYDIKSGDLQKGDELFTRKFALINPRGNEFFLDCIMRTKNVIGDYFEEGSTIDFKIEAVDRQGNMSAWPDKLTAVAGPGSFVCNGDSCGCCMMHAHSQMADISECKGLTGMVSPSSFPNGFCIDGL